METAECVYHDLILKSSDRDGFYQTPHLPFTSHMPLFATPGYFLYAILYNAFCLNLFLFELLLMSQTFSVVMVACTSSGVKECSSDDRGENRHLVASNKDEEIEGNHD